MIIQCNLLIYNHLSLFYFNNNTNFQKFSSLENDENGVKFLINYKKKLKCLNQFKVYDEIFENFVKLKQNYLEKNLKNEWYKMSKIKLNNICLNC
jgi:hypothetical protein